MRGLLAKEWCVIRKNSAAIFLIILLFAVIGVFSRTVFMFAYIAVFLGVIPVNYMALDEACRWQQYALAMPYRRSTIVAAKYLMMLMLAAAATLITAAGLFIHMLLYNGPDAELYASYLTGTFAAGILLPSIAFPFSFRFGTAKGRGIMLAAVCALTSVLSMVFIDYAESVTFNAAFRGGESHAYPLIPAILSAAAAICAASWLISVKVYENKDL